MVDAKSPVKKREERRNLLLNAACEVFAEKGFDGARVDEIASRAGVNKALINYYFGSKTMLFQAIMDDFSAAFMERLQGAINPDDSPIDQLRSYVKSIAMITNYHPHLPRILIFEAATGARHMERPPTHGPEAIGILATILERGHKAGVLRELNPVCCYFHIISSMAFFHITAGMRKKMGKLMLAPLTPPDADEFSEFLEDQVIAGFSIAQSQGGDHE